MLLALCRCRRPSQVRRGAFTRSPVNQLPVASPSHKSTSPVENFGKTRTDSSSASRTSSTKKSTSVDIPAPKSSTTKNSSTDSVTGKLADELLATKSAAEPQHASHGAKNSSSSKQKMSAGEQARSTVVDHGASSSRNISHSSTTTPRSGRLRASKHAGSSKTDLRDNRSKETVAFEMSGKRPKQTSSTKVDSARGSVSEKQPTSAHGNSRPTSRLSVYVVFIVM